MTRLNGTGWMWPDLTPLPLPTLSASLSNTLTIDATGEKAAMAGRVWWPERSGTKSIRRVQFKFGPGTKTGGSALTLSLQNVLDTANPGPPDGIAGQTVAIPNASFAANTWHRTAPLSADRAVNYGDRLAVVIEFDGAGRLGTDSIIIACLTGSTAYVNQEGYCVHFTAGWVSPVAVPILVLEFSDGTYGTITGALPWSVINTHSYTASTAVADEYALAFTVPFKCTADALLGWIRCQTATADYDLALYQGTTPLQSVSVDASATQTLAVGTAVVPIPEQALLPGNTYYVSFRATGAGTISTYSIDVVDAAFWALCPGDATCNYATRLDSGAWSAVNPLRRLMAAVRISGFNVGGGQAMGTII